ncbi:capsular polysaccharide export protein [Yoonia tamlensis]|uniref:Capsular polysaccharide export protein n=1 Tax=Yoonia tamlensis TaxID=390270 RepID=A0A1I6HF77_9RHOB|nr:hypothetical protein [Yoonia tamlensis]SFR53133.1 capsular polysaccharide export protein [Yoonia tamlensis]
MYHYINRDKSGEAAKVLLLQGPVGPFFSELQTALRAQGFQAKHVTFNAGDAHFAARDQTLAFEGSLDDWARWLGDELRHDTPDFIVMFGAMRPLHYIARQVAAMYAIKVICLEEGYLRSGYVTCEIGGNNDGSPLCDWTPDNAHSGAAAAPATVKHGYLNMCFWAVIYYLLRDIRATSQQKPLFHRHYEGVIRLAASWVGHAFRRVCARLVSGGLLRKLRGRLHKKFMLVVLQVPSDSQLRYAARGWSNEKLIRETLGAFKHTQTTQSLVFKLHPLDRRARATRRLIQETARGLGLADRVRVLGAGTMGAVTQHATGMIVINSTSAFSALHHSIPVLVMGDAIYRHDAVVTVGDDPLDIWEFMNKRVAKPARTIATFIHAVKHRALLPGDYYCAAGRAIAAKEIAQKLKQEHKRAQAPLAASLQAGAA